MGKLTVVASDELHGLGADVGPPTAYTWTAPNLFPLFLPWLAVLGLLLLRLNRTAQAWWIWLPLGLLIGASMFLSPELSFIPSEPLDFFIQAFGSLAFGLAAVWLVSPMLESRWRILTFLKMLVTVAAVGAVALLVRQDWEEAWLIGGLLVFLGICAVVLVGALSLAALVCRRRYQPVRLSCWLLIFSVVLWLAIASPFLVMAMLVSGDGLEWEGLVVALCLPVLTVLTVLPFLILAYATDLFRERLKPLLHLEEPVPPPLVTPWIAPSPAP